MSTSANVTDWCVFHNVDEDKHLQFSQHAMCKDNVTPKLKEIPDPENWTLYCTWLDEDESFHESTHVNLKDYMEDKAKPKWAWEVE